MSALHRHMYRNPLDVVLDKERRSCKGCKHLVTGWGKQSCDKNIKPVKKCGRYKETE